MRKLLLLFSFLLFLFITPQALASGDFSTNYDVVYTVSENQNTRVQINITLINKSDIYYASSYKIHVGFPDIKNIRATDRLGNILAAVDKKDDEQIISVNFNDKVTGINNRLAFSISFDTPDVAHKLGKIWEVNIPGLSSQSDLTNFNVTVNVPKNFGTPSFIKPQIKNAISGNTYSFTRSDLGSSGISMTFGNEQVYKLSLIYHLYNKNLFPIRTEIALPPNTNYQEVEIDNISSPPNNVNIDRDGNWLAEYSLSPSQKKDVVVNAKIRLKLDPSIQPESETKLSQYLKTDDYWETNDKNIREKAKELKTPSEIYKFVSSYLKYDYSRVTSDKPRLGALKTFGSPSSAVCLEFTDLFIAIARAAGIPAREVDGFAYTQNSKERPLSLIKDVLHAWPQYYNREKKTWIMIDPTWANTTGGIDYFNTLDFDHIAFVIKGIDSNYPVPAGGYKISANQNVKDVEVTFADNFESESFALSITNNLPNKIIAGFPFEGSITVKNAGKIISPPQKLIVESSVLQPSIQKFTVKEIPPYGNSTIPVTYNKTPFLTNKTAAIRIVLSGSMFVHEVRITPLFLNEWSLIGGAVVFGIFIIVISAVAFIPWNLSLDRRKL